MSAHALKKAHVRPRRLRQHSLWRMHLSHRILAATFATGGVSLLAVLLALAPFVALEPGAVPWVRAGGAVLIAGAAAFAFAGVLVRQIVGPISDLQRVIDQAWVRHGSGAGRGSLPREPSGGYSKTVDLSGALRHLLETLSDRVAANESVAADIAHEIRNPLTSLRSAAEAMRRSDEDQRARLVDIIEQDVMRLDRLVGEISSTSRLDAELVRERAVEFDLLATLRTLVTHLSHRGAERGIEIISDLPAVAVRVVGLEPRLAQVIVNLVENAISLCEEGDAIRMWVRPRDRRVLVVIEDTGPGIPEGEAEKIFRRFYSNRPESQSGDNLGLGLAISRQIVEAHGGVIWAENIRPTESDILSEPLGARFVVVLPQ